MNIDTVLKYLSRAVFVFALAAIAIAFLKAALISLGYTLLGVYYTPGRLLELSAILLVFVIVILLRQIRDDLRNNKNS